MYKTLFAFLILTSTAFADTVTIDTQGWTQDQINMIQAMAVKILYDNNVSYTDIKAIGGEVRVDNPSGSLAVINKQNIETAYLAWKAEIDVQNALAIAEYNAKQTEIQTNEVTALRLSQIDARIDSINNLSEMKIFLKKLVRYIKSKE